MQFRQQTKSKRNVYNIATYSVVALRSAQPPTLSGTGNKY